jgi:hypothetical protein
MWTSGSVGEALGMMMHSGARWLEYQKKGSFRYRTRPTICSVPNLFLHGHTP